MFKTSDITNKTYEELLNALLNATQNNQLLINQVIDNVNVILQTRNEIIQYITDLQNRIPADKIDLLNNISTQGIDMINNFGTYNDIYDGLNDGLSETSI